MTKVADSKEQEQVADSKEQELISSCKEMVKDFLNVLYAG